MSAHALLEVRNVITLLWFIVTSVLVMLFGWYLWQECKDDRHWWKKLPNQLALPLFIHFLGGEIVRLCLLVMQVFGHRTEAWGWILLVLGGSLSMFGAMGVVYVLAPKRAYEIACATLILVLAVVLLIYNTDLLNILIG